MENSPSRGKVALIVNTRSRKGAALFEKAQDLLHQAGVAVSEAHGVTEPAQMRTRVDQALRNGADLVIVGGGDGSISGTIGGLMGSSAAFAPLPLGTANSFARGLGVGPDLEDAVAVIAEGHSEWLDLAEIDGHMFANSAAIGVPPVIGDTIPPRLKRWLGRAGYLAWAAWSLVKFAPFRLTIRGEGIDRTCWATELRMLNGQYTGGIKVSEEANPNSGRILVQVVSGKSKWTLARDWYLRMLGLLRRPGMADELQARRLEIDARPRQKVAIDGEVLARTPFTLTLHPRAVRVITAHPAFRQVDA